MLTTPAMFPALGWAPLIPPNPAVINNFPSFQFIIRFSFSNRKSHYGNLVFSKTKNLNAISEVPIFIKDILLEIEKRNLKREKIEKLFLFGAKISNELLINIESSLNISSTIIEPFNELKLDIAHLNERLSIGNLTKYSSALGMALRLVS